MSSAYAYMYFSQQLPMHPLRIIILLLFVAIIFMIAIFATMIYTRLEHRRMHNEWKHAREVEAASAGWTKVRAPD
mgnify:CR=1 FL=1